MKNLAVMQAILQKIKDYDRIALFRHQRIDGDCTGAAKGLQAMLRATFPDKTVLLIDDEHSDFLAFMGPCDAPVPEDWYQDALGIVIDTATAARIASPHYKRCRELIKIDHHIDREPFADICWVEEDRSSACEMIAAFYAAFPQELTLTREAAAFIYTGMVTDSGRFQYEGVQGDTLRLAAMLLDTGIDTASLYANLYLRDFATLKFKAYVYEHMQMTKNGVAYLYIDRAMQERFGLTMESASAAISYLERIKGCLCWLAFIENTDGRAGIRVRLRSRFMAINEVAERHHGGGHACASGATVYSKDEMHALLHEADEAVRLYKATHTGWL